MHSCPQCSKVYKRPEHLKRHQSSSHGRVKLYTCPTCGRKFNRQDSFQRHLAVHGLETAAASASAQGVSRRQQSSCFSCADSHTRCTRHLPCDRCLRHAIPCRYPPTANPEAVGSAQLASSEKAQSPGSTAATLVATDSGTSLNDEAAESFVPQSSTFSQTTRSTDLSAHHSASELEPSSEWFASQLNWLPVLAPQDAPVQLSSVPSHGLQQQAFPPADETSAQQPNQPVASPVNNVVSPAVTASTETSTTVSSKGLYVHGRGSRESQQQRASKSRLSLQDSILKDPSLQVRDDGSMVFDLSSAPSTVVESEAISVSLYLELRDVFEIVANQENSFFRRFDSDHFPSKSYFDQCVVCFNENAAQDLPIIHSSIWRQARVSWLLLLAVCTAGALSHPTNSDNRLAFGLQEFLRRALCRAIETGSTGEAVLLQQSSLLNVFVALHLYEPGSPQVQAAFASLTLVDTRLSRAAGQAGRETDLLILPPKDWYMWVDQETNRRLQYFSWHLLCYSILLGAREIQTDFNSVHIPGPGALWEAPSAAAWDRLQATVPQPPTVHEALQSLYIRRQIPNDMETNDFIPVVHGLINQTLEIGRQLRIPLSQWVPGPSLDQNSFDRSLSEQVEWLPANSTYASWRNSACDCLDLLHWRSNVEVAANAGRETPTVLHLHLARLIILSPFQEIISFARHASEAYAAGAGHTSIESAEPSSAAACPQHIRTAVMRWLTLDDHKGRLSIIHAGASFWHIRRFARGSVYEPFAIFLATLVLWVYALYQPQVRSVLAANKLALSRFEKTADSPGADDSRSQTHSCEGDSESSEDPTSFLLDRPCDDEMVQLFIRRGLAMEPYMFGEVRICTGEGYKKVLQEGIKLLFCCRGSSYAKAYEYQTLLLGLLAEKRDGSNS